VPRNEAHEAQPRHQSERKGLGLRRRAEV
jgi:hypothetical protein